MWTIELVKERLERLVQKEQTGKKSDGRTTHAGMDALSAVKRESSNK
jgi:hypothetical protein